MKQTTNSPELPLRIGITGGIGSGKSYVCHQLEQAGHRIFYCDDEAKRIIRTHPDVMDELRALVGAQVYDADGGLNKPVLAAYLCQGRHYSQQVDRIVHPPCGAGVRAVLCGAAVRDQCEPAHTTQQVLVP